MHNSICSTNHHYHAADLVVAKLTGTSGLCGIAFVLTSVWRYAVRICKNASIPLAYHEKQVRAE